MKGLSKNSFKMVLRERSFLFSLLLIAILTKPSFSIRCYQCSGISAEHPFQCNEWLNNDIDMEADSCDFLHDAKFCVKHTGRYEASSIDCYQCSSASNLDCADGMIHLGGIKSHNCDHVFEAQYCIKARTLDGGIGTKRFCSSLDLGNYCNYVKQPGDLLTYRTCVFTCTGDGCNPSNTIRPSLYILSLSIALAMCFFNILR